MKTINRRAALTAGASALALAGATTCAPIPAIAMGGEDPIVAMFAERNRLFFDWCAASAAANAENAAVMAKFPPRATIPARREDQSYEEAIRDPAYRAWARADREWQRRYGNAVEAKLELRYRGLEAEHEAIFERMWVVQDQILAAAPQSVQGVAIKLWLSCDLANEGDLDWRAEDNDEPGAAQRLIAFHDLCRLFGLTIVGGISKVGGGSGLAGSDRGEPVGRAVS